MSSYHGDEDGDDDVNAGDVDGLDDEEDDEDDND